MKNLYLTLLLVLCAWPGAGTAQAASSGLVLAWGAGEYNATNYPNAGQSVVPVAAQSGVTAIAAGGFHTVALKTNGSVVAWGNNDYGQTNVPVAAQSGVTAIAAGGYHSVALLGTAPPPLPQLTITRSGANVILTWPTNAAGFTLQSAPALTGTFTNIPGATNPYTNPIAGAQQFYRLSR